MGRFTAEEDQKILDLVKEGLEWPEIASRVDGRNTKQIRDRWNSKLDPELKPTTEPWTEDEDALLYHGYQAWGSAWGQVTSLIKGRSSNMAKNRWYSKFMNAKANTEFFSKEASARAAEAVRKAPKVGVTPGTLAPRAPGKPRPKHRDPTRPIGYYHADTMCYRDDPESRAKAEAWSKEQNAATEFAGGSHMNLNADGQRQPGTYHRAFKNLPTVAGQRIRNPLPRRGAAPGRRKRAGSDDDAPRKKSKRKYNPDPPLPLGIWGSDEPIQVEEHHAKRGQSGDRYERYKAARTVIEYEQLGGSARDLRFDLARGLVRCLGEFARPAPATTPAPPPRQRAAPQTAPPMAPPPAPPPQVMAPPPPPGATIPPPVCGVCQEPFQDDDADELPCCKARVCDACAKEVVAIVTCPFCGGDPSPSPPPPPPEEDCSNDAAIALALSRSWA